MTRYALDSFGPTVVGLGRAVLAAMAASIGLLVMRAGLPRREEWAPLGLVAVGAVIGFPLLTARALESVPTSHVTVTASLAPLGTAVIGAVRGGERPSRSFWLASLAGATAVLAFGLSRTGELSLASTDLLLLASVVLVSLGYAEGGRLSRTMGGVRVISWALVLALPVTLPLTALAVLDGEVARVVSTRALMGLLYVALVSMYAAYFAWYRGLSTAGIANASQVQLLQPVLGLIWSVALLGEPLSLMTVITGGAVIACAAWARLARVPVLS